MLKIADIAKKADEKGLCMFDRMSLIMDLQAVHKQFNLNLNEFLNANDFDFTHDIMGIQHNINRETKELENCFLPRFSIAK